MPLAPRPVAGSPIARTVPTTARFLPPASAAALWRPALRARAMTALGAAAIPPAAPAVGSLALEDLTLASSFTADLPADANTSNHTRQVEGAAFSYVDPTPTGGTPSTLAVSQPVLAALGLAPSEAARPEFASTFAGATPLPGARSFAACYGGHQFGSWAGQLGDGRAIGLGDVPVVNPETADPSASLTAPRLELQLKGAGRTPYSRFADGRAVLRSSVREFVMSEAMAAAGVRTTRALSLVATGEDVVRDQFYDGRAAAEPGAVVCRIAASFVRFGSFELPASRGDKGLVRALADHVLCRHYPDLHAAHPAQTDGEAPTAQDNARYGALLNAALARTATTVAAWQGMGWCHGVLNTDNCSILGDTIDYGPFGYVEAFDPAFTPNTSDSSLRYSFRGQPAAACFNAERLASAFVVGGLVDRETGLTATEAFGDALADAYEGVVASKLGLPAYDRDLSVAWMGLLARSKADWTNAWRALGGVRAGDAPGSPPPTALAAALSGSVPPPADADPSATVAWATSGVDPAVAAEAAAWLDSYRAALLAAGVVDDAARAASQSGVNPAYIARNHLLHAAIEGLAKGDGSGELDALMEALMQPYTVRPGLDRFRAPAPAARVGVELLSCSS